VGCGGGARSCQILINVTLKNGLIISKQVIPSNEILRSLDILILPPPYCKTIKDTLGMESTPLPLVHPQLPPHKLHLALLAGHHASGVGHPEQDHGLLRNVEVANVRVKWCNLKRNFLKIHAECLI
jgi:hypothetical protein